jgi:polyhydroxybutyrate depolymerase
MIAFHGTADPLTRYQGGKVFHAPDPFPDIPGWLAGWAQRNRCAPTPVESAASTDVTRVTFVNCVEPVVFYRIEGGGHTWPGGVEMPEWFVGRTTQTIDASELMWEFFKDHSLSH